MNDTTLLQLDGVSMHYGKGETAITALAGVDLTVKSGELMARESPRCAGAPWGSSSRTTSSRH